MARMLNVKNSSEKLRNTVRRHIRLVKQIVNNSELIAQIQPANDALGDKQQQVNNKRMEREDRYDDVLLADGMLDDAVRDLFAHCERYDRTHPGERVLKQVFPDEKYGDLLRLPFMREVKEVEKIVVRIDALGQDHELAPNGPILTSRIEDVGQAIFHHEDAIHQVKVAEAEEEIAKENLARQYELNYLDARREYGKRTADKLFPRITQAKQDELPDSNESDEDVA